ncbi:MAG TPA: ribonuclease III [Candidatus Dojkabacteria bacterium]|nr:ribonuclease III [Candidatus Dojkabacteria bacterium]
MKNNNDYKEIEEKLGVTFESKDLLRNALIHRSYTNENKKEQKNNERLEFLGDAVLELIISEYLYNEFPDKPEGELTAIRAATVRTESLAQESRILGIGQYLLMSKGEEKSGGKDKEYLLANLYEAILGAMYLDQGFSVCKKFIHRTLLKKINRIMSEELFVDPKTKVQEIIQSKYRVTPTYKTVKEEGPDHDKHFTVVLNIGKKNFAKGTGSSKQRAQEEAAKEALLLLNKKS